MRLDRAEDVLGIVVPGVIGAVAAVDVVLDRVSCVDLVVARATVEMLAAAGFVPRWASTGRAATTPVTTKNARPETRKRTLMRVSKSTETAYPLPPKGVFGASPAFR
jgi:hypothetical protein